jgi:nitroreductase
MVDYAELLEKRRSIRDFQEKEVPLELIQDILKDACLAPSAGNGQPWKFIVVRDKDWIRRLSEESKKNILSQIEKDPHASMKKYETRLRDKDFNVFYNAPCLVYFVGSRDVQSLAVDCSLAACYFMLAATARGLGTCWVALGADLRDPLILKAVGLPGGYRIVAPIILGYPKSIPSAPVRNNPEILKTIP